MSSGVLSRVTAGPVPQRTRRGRRPVHSFQVRHHPWQIVPFAIAPVLPGDSLTNAMLQVRAVSDPVKNPLIGWWLEHFVFYLPHRSLVLTSNTGVKNTAMVDKLTAMMLDPNLTTRAAGTTIAANDLNVYTSQGDPDYVTWCLGQIVERFFRDPGEPVWGTGAPLEIGTAPKYPPAQISNTSWLDSAMLKSVFDASQPADVDVDGPDANTTIQASEIDKAMRTWQMLRDNALTDQTYEDFLRTYGVRVPDRETEIKPELLRYSREWTYPSNTIDPTTGSPSSALSWSIMERMDKKRFFKEPGFVFGVTVARPKVYLSKQRSAAVSMLENVFTWLPAVLGNDPYSSLVAKTPTAGPLSGQAADYIVDVKDLYLYGDQFLNFDLSATDAGLVALPSSTLQKKYPTTADMQGLFKAVADTGRLVRQDGVLNLSFESTVIDTTAKV